MINNNMRLHQIIKFVSLLENIHESNKKYLYELKKEFILLKGYEITERIIDQKIYTISNNAFLIEGIDLEKLIDIIWEFENFQPELLNLL